MTYYLIVSCLVLVFLYEIGRTRECDLVDVFLNLIHSHTDTVIYNLDGLCCRIYNDIYPCLVSVGQCIFTHHVELF